MKIIVDTRRAHYNLISTFFLNLLLLHFILHNDIEYQQIVLSSPLAYKMAIHIKRLYYRHLAIYIRALYISRLFNATFLPTQWHRTSKDRVIVTLWSTQWHWTSAVRVVVTCWPTQWHWTSADYLMSRFCLPNDIEHQLIILSSPFVIHNAIDHQLIMLSTSFVLHNDIEH